MSTAKDGDAAQNTSDATVYYEEILERCCGTGRWQVLLVSYFSLMWLLHPFFSMSLMFVGATPAFKCADGFGANATFASLPADTPQCHRHNGTDACTCWVFDTSVFESTVVTEWSLVCDRKPLLSMLHSWLMIGGLAGSLIGGPLADRLGRRTVFLPAMLVATCCAFAVVLVPDYTSYAAVWCLAGVAIWVMIAGVIVLVAELGGVKHRAALSTLFILPFAFGTMLVAALSYAIRTRWLLQLAYAAPWLLLLPSFCLMPESPRWLVAKGRFTEAYNVLRQGARWNRRQMPSEQQVLQLMKEASDGMLVREAAMKSAAGDSALQRTLQFVRTPRMRQCTLCYIFISFVISASFYGISFDVTKLSDNPHLAGVLSGLMDVPAYLIFPLLNCLGRRYSMTLFLLVTSAAMFLVLTKQDPTLWLALGLVGKMGASSAFTMVGMYFGELMPTPMRGMAIMVVIIATSIGGAVAPFIVELVSQLHSSAPSLVFGTAALLAGLTTLLLPESAGQRMPETAADAEAAQQKAAVVATSQRANHPGDTCAVHPTAVSAANDQQHCNAAFQMENGS